MTDVPDQVKPPRWMGWSNGEVSWHRCLDCGAWIKDDWDHCVSTGCASLTDTGDSELGPDGERAWLPDPIQGELDESVPVVEVSDE